MTSLDLGGLFATADIVTAPFDRKYPILVRQFADLSARAEAAAGGLVSLDDGLSTVAATAGTAAAGLSRSGKAASDVSVGMDRASRSASLAGKSAKDSAVAFIALGDSTNRVKTAQLGLIAAQERLDRVLASGTATTEQYARAQSSVVAAEERVAAAQRAAATSTARAAAVQRDATVASKGLTGGLAGTLKMAGELGLVFGAFEAVKKAIDITKEANQYQRSMVQIRNLTGASKAQVDALSSTLLNMAGKVAQSPEDLAVSAYHAESSLRKLGATAPQIYKAIEVAAKGATIGGTDLEDTTNALTATMASGIVPFNQAGKAMGALLSIVGAGDMKVSDLNDALSTGLLVTMKTFGVSLTDTGAALAVFGDNNIRGQDAATKLRMAVQDLSKGGANADAVLGHVNLTTAQLRDTLEKKGLNGALEQLKSHLDAAGVTGKQVGGFLEDAFTKRAGVGLALLLTRMNQFDEARVQVQKGAGSFGQQWANVTKTASYALSSLGHEIEAEGIKIAQSATPAVTDLAKIIGVALPAAVDIAVGAARPFVAVWRTGAAVLSPVVHWIAGITSASNSLGPELKLVASGALAAYAAFKLLRLGQAIFTGLKTAVTLARVKVLEMGAAFETTSAEMSTAGIVGSAAMAGIGIAVGIATIAWAAHASAVAKSKAEVDSLTDALNEDSGAMGKNTQTAIANTLQSSGALDAARTLGLSLHQVTAAAIGGSPAIDRLLASVQRYAYGAYGSTKDTSKQVAAYRTLQGALGDTSGNLSKAVQGYKNVKAATDPATASTSRSVSVQRAAVLTAKQLDTALQNLGQTELAAAQSQDSFREGILTLTKTLHTNHDQLGLNTQAGLANRDALLGMLGQAVSLANAQYKNGRSIDAVTGSLQGNVRQLIQTATQAGLSKSAVRALVQQMGLTPHDIATKFQTNAPAVKTQLDQVLTTMRTIGQGVNAKVNITTTTHGGTQTHTVTANAAGSAATYHRSDGTVPPNTVATVGEGASHTWEGLVTDSRGRARVFSNSQSKAMGFPEPRAYAQGSGDLAGAMSFARAQNSKPYEMGTAGPSTFDCSGLVSGVIDKYLGRSQGRLFSTSNEGSVLPGLGFKSGNGNGNAAMIVGWEHDSRLEHTTGRIGNLNFEAYGDRGVPLSQQIRVGGNARDPRSFPNVMHLPGGGKDASGPAGDGSGSGSGAGGVRKLPGGDWTYGGSPTHYASKRAAENAYRSHEQTTAKSAAEAAKARAKTQAQGARSAAQSYRGLSHGVGNDYRIVNGHLRGDVESVSDIRSGLSDTEKGLRQAGLSKAMIASLAKDNAAIVTAARGRNKAAAELARANKALIAAQKMKASDRRTFAAAVTGSFDITSAGKDSNGRVTSGSLFASESQDVTIATAFVKGIDRLADMKIFPPSYLRQLAGENPADALPTIRALLRMPKGKLTQFAANERTLARLGQTAGARVSARLDNARIREDKHAQDVARHRENERQKHLEAVLGNFRDDVTAELKHLHMKIDWTNGELSRAVETDKRKTAHRGGLGIRDRSR